MATYKGKSVKLNKPRRIGKGETSYGKKKSVVYVKDGDKVKRVTFGDPNMRIKKNQKGRRILGLDITVILLDQKQKQDTGLAGHGDMAKTAIKKVAQAEIRAAKSFLKRRGLDTDDVSPKKFAQAAKELDKGFVETLRILARELSGGQV